MAGRIFISYRREDTAFPAGWLFDRLVEHFGRGQVFKDVDSIQLGDKFAERISDAVASTDVLLALIGDEWLTIADKGGRRRLDDPEDFVRLEIESALTRNVRVIPVLIDGVKMPPAEKLPPTLAPLTGRQALELSPSRFESDIMRLLKLLDPDLAKVQTPPRGDQREPFQVLFGNGNNALLSKGRPDGTADIVAQMGLGPPTEGRPVIIVSGGADDLAGGALERAGATIR